MSSANTRYRKEQWGQINVFDEKGVYIGMLNYVYKSRIENGYIKRWLCNSLKFHDWSHFVFWLNGEKIKTYYRYK